MLCSIDLSQAVELEFTIQVFGSTSSSVEPRFIIVGEEFAVTCFCTPQDSSVKVSIPCLKNIFKAGTYRAKFEVILGEQIFTPIDDEIELTEPVKVEVSAPTLKPTVAAPKIEVKMTPKVSAPVTAPPPVEEEEVIEEPVKVSAPLKPLAKPAIKTDRVSFESLKQTPDEERKKKLPLFKDLNK